MARFVPLAIALFSAYWIFAGWFLYDFWIRKGPGGGFLAVLVGSLTLILSLIELFKGKKTSFTFNKRYLYPAIALIVMILAINWLGMILSIGLFVILWLKFIEKYPWIRSLIYGICTTLIIWGAFKFILHVPFPRGIFGI